MECRVLQSRDCRITQPFHNAGEKGYTYYHGGIDLVRYFAQLDWIVAHTEGKVIGVETKYTGAVEDGSYGNYVWVLHPNGYSTLYAHLAYDTIQVKVGQWVSKGQLLGYMDNTGHSYGGHLHWEVRTKDNVRIDPEPYLNTYLPGMIRWVENINGGWWCVSDGLIDKSYNGVAQNENGWWKCKNGQVDFNFTGLAQNENGWWYCNKGKVDFAYQGIVQNDYGWWKVTNGKVDFSYNGLANNQYGWWMLQGGKVDFDYNGLAVNANGTWVVEKGKVNFNYTGNYTFSGKTYTIKGGKVI